MRELDAVYDELWTATSNCYLNIGSRESKLPIYSYVGVHCLHEELF